MGVGDANSEPPVSHDRERRHVRRIFRFVRPVSLRSQATAWRSGFGRSDVKSAIAGFFYAAVVFTGNAIAPMAVGMSLVVANVPLLRPRIWASRRGVNTVLRQRPHTVPEIIPAAAKRSGQEKVIDQPIRS